MPEGTRDGSRNGSRPDEEADLSARLQRLGQRLDQKMRSDQQDEAGPPPSTNTAGLAQGLRLSTELVAGVIVGAGIGWVLDRALGISPWGFIVFLLLGFVAGMLNLMRSAGLVANRGQGNKR